MPCSAHSYYERNCRACNRSHAAGQRILRAQQAKGRWQAKRTNVALRVAAARRNWQRRRAAEAKMRWYKGYIRRAPVAKNYYRGMSAGQISAAAIAAQTRMLMDPALKRASQREKALAARKRWAAGRAAAAKARWAAGGVSKSTNKWVDRMLLD